MNIRGTLYHTDNRTMGELEQEAVRKVVRGKLRSYEVQAITTRQVTMGWKRS